MPIDVGLLRGAAKHACVLNATVPVSQLPPIDEPMRPGMEHVCGAMRGTIRCAAHSLRCALNRRYDDVGLGYLAQPQQDHGTVAHDSGLLTRALRWVG